MTVAGIVTAGAALAAASLAGLGWYFSGKVIHIRTKTNEFIHGEEIAAERIAPGYFESLPKEKATIESPYGYALHGWFIPHGTSDKTVILVHGVTMSVFGSLKYIELFRKRGFNVLVYDHRRHGLSGGKTTTYGWHEKHDLDACIDWVLQRTGPDAKIGIHGESMGAATALQHAAIDNRAAFYIADCPYSDLFEQLRYRLKAEYRLPPFPMLYIAGWFCRLRAGFSFRKVSPIADITTVETPVLFIHGQNDTYIPKEMSKEMHRLKPDVKKLYLAPNANHAEAIWKNPEEYDRVVGTFLTDIGME